MNETQTYSSARVTEVMYDCRPPLKKGSGQMLRVTWFVRVPRRRASRIALDIIDEFASWLHGKMGPIRSEGGVVTYLDDNGNPLKKK